MTGVVLACDTFENNSGFIHKIFEGEMLFWFIFKCPSDIFQKTLVIETLR